LVPVFPLRFRGRVSETVEGRRWVEGIPHFVVEVQAEPSSLDGGEAVVGLEPRKVDLVVEFGTEKVESFVDFVSHKDGLDLGVDVFDRLAGVKLARFEDVVQFGGSRNKGCASFSYLYSVNLGHGVTEVQIQERWGI
jgi:hypothetical protein